MDMGRNFRCMFNLKKDQDIVALIEAAVDVASVITPDKLKRHRRRIMRPLFDQDLAYGDTDDDMFCENEELCLNNNEDMFCDDEELCLSNNEDGNGLRASICDHSTNNISILPPQNNVCPTPRKVIKIHLKGFKKTQKVSQVVLARPPSLLVSKKSKDQEDNLMELKLEATKRKLGQMYAEEAEKKIRRKIQCIDFPESKILCGGRNNNKNDNVKVPRGSSRERLLAKMNRRRH